MRLRQLAGGAALLFLGGAACFVPDHAALGAKLVDECRVIPGVIPSCACMGVGYENDACRAATDLTFDEAVSDESEQACVLAHECQGTGEPDDIAVLHDCLSATSPYGPPEGADPTCLSACVATMEACANTGCNADNVLFCMRDERACERQCVP